MKYLDYAVTFSEFPDEIALCINITNCPFHCSGCHSPELWEDVGNILDIETLESLIKSNKGISCVGFMGGPPEEVNMLAQYINVKYENIKVGWYTGYSSIPIYINTKWFDYIKLGPYNKELGGLDNPNTNQQFYHIRDGVLVDWTYKFQKHGNK